MPDMHLHAKEWALQPMCGCIWKHDCWAQTAFPIEALPCFGQVSLAGHCWKWGQILRLATKSWNLMISRWDFLHSMQPAMKIHLGLVSGVLLHDPTSPWRPVGKGVNWICPEKGNHYLLAAWTYLQACTLLSCSMIASHNLFNASFVTLIHYCACITWLKNVDTDVRCSKSHSIPVTTLFMTAGT